MSLKEFNAYLPWTISRVNRIPKTLWELLFADFKVQAVINTKVTNLMVFLYTKHFGNCDPCCPKTQRQIFSWFSITGRSIYNLDQLESILNKKPQAVKIEKAHGFNLVGYSRGRLGLGEDLRGFISVFELLNIPFSVYNIGHSSDAPNDYMHSNEDYSLPYDHSIFCMNVIELSKLIQCYDGDLSQFAYCIAASPWELPKVPEKWGETLSHFQEIWAISRFVEKSYKDAFKNKINTKYVAPVAHIPNKVCVQDLKRQSRPFTFLFMFDAKSYLKRKNPEAIAKAFLKAFQVNEQVRLVIKSTSKGSGSDWQSLIKLVQSDSRILLKVGSMSESEMTQFWKNCDCYVSLHRSEGFGRTLVEAVARKIPVVATGWSGSTDIIAETNPLAVEYRVKQLDSTDYPEGGGQYWAEPLESSAAQKLRWVYENRGSNEIANIVSENYINFQNNFSVTAEKRNQILQSYLKI
ncbi:glycosyltransferase [Alteromonas sp. B31-7]|uniref:glycosyltransferase n=1 Tax=Alteromonas sp. B31-7 TaxID=2785913 RepID=UPI0018CA9C1C|nr:glycosyltransferase [Alteromonas sp. B31-7]QPL50574.1 glycosyltransferase [Alteromonas sp. B31-7]